MRSRFSLWLVLNIFLFVVPAWAQDQWLEVRSSHFRVLSDGGERRARETAREFEQLRSVFTQVVPQNTVDDSWIIREKIRGRLLSLFRPTGEG